MRLRRDRLRPAQHDRHRRDVHIRRRMRQRVIREAVIEHGLRRLEAVQTGVAVEHHGDQLHPIALCRRGQAVSRRRGIAGFQAGRSVVKPHQLIGVGKAELAVADGVHPDGRVFLDPLVLEKLPRHERDVIRRRQMLSRIRPVVQTGAVHKVRVRHAKLLRPLVHHAHERAFAAGDVLRQCAGAVVGGGHNDRFEHLRQRQLLIFLQIDLTPALGGGLGRGRHGVVPRDPAVLQRLHDEQQRHDLRDASRRELFVAVLLVENFSGRFFHQDRRRSRKLQIRRPRADAGRRRDQHAEKKTYQPFSHKKSPFRFIWYKRMKRKGSI